MLKNDPFWKGQWAWQLSMHGPSALQMPASAHATPTVQLLCPAEPLVPGSHTLRYN